MTRFDTKNTFIARPNVNVQQIFLISFLAFVRSFLLWSVALRLNAWASIVLVFHFIYFAPSPSKIIYIFFVLSRVSCLSWWHRNKNDGVANALATHTANTNIHRERDRDSRDTNTFSNIFIIRFSFICLVLLLLLALLRLRPAMFAVVVFQLLLFLSF